MLCLLTVVCCSLSLFVVVRYSLLFVVCLFVCCPLFVAVCVLFGVRCSLFVVGCLLFVVFVV